MRYINSNLVTIGFRAKTGRAIAVVLGGSPDAPTILTKTEIKLVDPRIPETAQPYHEVMDLPWQQSQRAAQKFVQAIQKVAAKEIAQLIQEQKNNGSKVAGVGIVGAPDRDLSRIGNNHIRAHAAEGVLFRSVLEYGADRNGIKRRTFSDRNFATDIKAELGKHHVFVTLKIEDLRRTVSPPWRSDEKQAALAAWVALHGK